VGADHAGVLEVGGDLLLHSVAPRLQEDWNNDWFESHIVGTLLKSMAAKTVWDTVRY